MYKFYISLFCILLSTVLGSCEDSTKNEPDNETQEAEYYVKYEASVTTVYISNSIVYTVNTDKGTKNFKNGNSFSQTFGPFRKGFNASVTADASNLYQAACNVKIYVCRGSEPFALKAYQSGGKKVSASYTIDF